MAAIARQAYSDWELIVINDGSTDDTVQVVTDTSQALGIADKTRLLTQDNQGVAVARNLGMAEAYGEYFAFLDADDAWLPDKLSVDVQALEKAKTPVALVYGAYTMVNEEGWPTHQSPLFTQSGALGEQMMTTEGLMLPSNTVVHRLIVEEFGGFPTDCYHEDRAFFLLASRGFPALATGQRQVVYQQALSGRCRRILSDYDTALAAERSIVDSVQKFLPPDDLDRLWVLQRRFLISRFLMYGFMPSAQRLARELEAELKQHKALAARLPKTRDKKSLLSSMSLKTGFNFLETSRCLYQKWFQARHRAQWKPIQDGLYSKLTLN